MYVDGYCKDTLLERQPPIPPTPCANFSTPPVPTPQYCTTQVASLRESVEDEFKRRCESERALREAAAMFKRELFEK